MFYQNVCHSDTRKMEYHCGFSFNDVCWIHSICLKAIYISLSVYTLIIFLPLFKIPCQSRDLDFMLSLWRTQVQSLVRELRSHKPCSTANIYISVSIPPPLYFSLKFLVLCCWSLLLYWAYIVKRVTIYPMYCIKKS